MQGRQALADPDARKVAQLLRDLIAIPSVNPTLDPMSAGEGALASFVADYAARAGLDAALQEVLPGRPNVVVRLEPAKPRATLVLEAHLDTVPLSACEESLATPSDDGRVYGRGACDVKGGLAAALDAVERLALRRDELQTRIELIASVDEEVAYAGVTHYLANNSVDADGAVVIEPTKLEIVVAHKGCVRVAIETKGRSAHTSMPERGANAIDAMIVVLAAVKGWHRQRLDLLTHPLADGTLVTVSTISGGIAANIVPEACQASIDYRTLPNEDPELTLKDLEALLAQIRHDHEIQCEIAHVNVLDWGLDTSPEAAIVGSAIAASDLVLGAARCVGAPYGSDASKFSRLAGIPAIVLGPGDIADAHSDDEWVAIADVVTASRLYEQIALELPRAVEATRQQVTN